MGPGVASECVETKDGPVVWEDHFYPEIVDPVSGRGAAGWRARRARVHHAHQGGAAADPLPHARPDRGSCRRPRARCAAWRASAALRRHADHPRCERVPESDRGAGAAARRASRRTISSSSRATAHLDQLAVQGRVPRRARRRQPRAARGCSAGARRRGIKAFVGHLDAGARWEIPGSLERSAGKAQRVVDRRR